MNRKQNKKQEAETRKPKKSPTINILKLNSPIKEQIGDIYQCLTEKKVRTGTLNMKKRDITYR